MCGVSKKPSVQKLWRGKANIIIIISHTNIGTKNYESKREKSNEEGTLELIQWPSGLYPFANRGLTGSWTDQLNQLINQ